MALAWCVDCGRAVHRDADESWKVRCIPCFKKHKRAEEAHAPWRVDESAVWRDRYLEADSQCFKLQCLVDDLRAQLAARPSLDSALADELREMLPRLRQLCHPDRHDGSVAANRASQWLNDLRARLH
jgi:hypothetical protein